MRLKPAIFAIFIVLVAQEISRWSGAIADPGSSSQKGISSEPGPIKDLLNKFDKMQDGVKKTFETVIGAAKTQGFSKDGQTLAERTLEKLEERVRKYEDYLLQLVPVITSKIRNGNGTNFQKLENTTIEKADRASVSLPCAINEGLKLCIWEHKPENGTRKVAVINPTFNGTRTIAVPRLTYDKDAVKSGDCSVNISDLEETDGGEWLCTLVAKTGTVHIGWINVTLNDGQL